MVISLSDFNKLSEKDQKKTLENLKQEIGVSGIVKAWEISRSKAYSMLRESNILVNSRKTTVKPKKSNNINTYPDITNPLTDLTIERLKKPVAQESPLDFDVETDVSKFFLNLETQGNASLINDALQALLGSGKISSANFHLNITLQEI
jgi:hypothetical protein